MTASLRIVMISEHASPLAATGSVDAGGQNVYVDQVARALARSGHEVSVFTRRDAEGQPDCMRLARGLRLFHIDAGPPQHVPKEQLLQYMPMFAARSRVLLGILGRPDIVHANFFMSGWVGLRLKEAMGMPLVTTFHALGKVRREHQGADDAFPRERIDIEQELVDRSDCVIAECPQDQEDLVRLHGADPGRLRMVACGVDQRQFHPVSRAWARRRLRLPDAAKIILQLGRIVPRKGIATVIEALAQLPSPAMLLVVGGDSEVPDPVATPEIGRLQALASELGVADRVHFLGRRSRSVLHHYYCAADVFVTTPWYEPFGITPLEAMACAVPVVGSAVGGIRYSVVDGETGLLVPPRDPQALSRALQKVLQDDALRDRLGHAGAYRVRDHFDWARIAQQLERVYRGLGPQGAKGIGHEGLVQWTSLLGTDPAAATTPHPVPEPTVVAAP